MQQLHPLNKNQNTKSELLLPVGNQSMLLAAIHGGADAVYIGVPKFNARGRTLDFSLLELKEMIDLAHLYEVKVYLAFNVLIFEEELEVAKNLLQELIPLSPDAFIVQDIGLIQLIKKICPEQTIHGSTQMTITNELAIKLLDDLEIKRFVLGRENSIAEIQKIKEKSPKEIEVFVHGALCVSYSGQCLTSEAKGGRSANRGQCAQSCRQEYEMFVDGKKINLKNKHYLFSPKDLCGIDQIEELQAIGVESFKIEGRLKSPEYVASSAYIYKKAINQIPLLPDDLSSLKLTYSRDFFSGWLKGVNHQKLVDGTFSSHRGNFVGTIKEIKEGKVFVNTKESSPFNLKAGDGILFDNNQQELGAPLYLFQFDKEKGELILEFSNNFSLLNLRPDTRVYQNSSPSNSNKWQQLWLNRQEQKKIKLQIYITAQLDRPLSLRAIDHKKNEIFITLEQNLTQAEKNQAQPEDFQKELKKLGNTCFKSEEIVVQMAQNLFIPNQQIKLLKRKMIEEMSKKRIERTIPKIQNPEIQNLKGVQSFKKANGLLNVLVRTKEQVQGLLNLKNKQQINQVVLDFEFGKNYERSLLQLKNQNYTVGIATNRILKPLEYHHLNTLLRLRPDFILARNLGAIQFFKEKENNLPIKGDFSLNVSNSWSAHYLFSKGIESLCPSYDLNQKQLISLLQISNPDKFEIVIHQHMPEFHMEHCIFAHTLSTGSSFKDCGRPCEQHQVEVQDPYGVRHLLKADQECRNTLFKSEAQSGLSYLGKWQDLGVKEFRLEFLDESEQDLEDKIDIYFALLHQKMTPKEAHILLKTKEKFGVTEGQLSFSDNYQDRKKI